MLARRIHEVIPWPHRWDFTVPVMTTRITTFSWYYLWFMFWLLMTQGIGGGVILEEIFEIPYTLAVVLTFSIVILYTMAGGFRSVAGVAFFRSF